MCRFLHARTWANAPVEVTRIFHQRVKAFMDKMLKTGSDQGGLLGRITNYVVRYEVRCMLWLVHWACHVSHSLQQQATRAAL